MEQGERQDSFHLETMGNIIMMGIYISKHYKMYPFCSDKNIRYK